MNSAEWRVEFERLFVPENVIPDSEEVFTSPSGQYRLEISSYTIKRPMSGGYPRGIVRRVADGAIIADVKRNHGIFWHSWATRPQDGGEFLFCGEDYQGYTIVNLTRGTVLTYLPAEAARGMGFCWTAAYLSPDGRTLAVDGCYWACPYEIVFYDFVDPSIVPLRELDRLDHLVDVIGWDDQRRFHSKHEYDVRASDGRRYETLPEEEQAALVPSQIDAKVEELTWERAVS